MRIKFCVSIFCCLSISLIQAQTLTDTMAIREVQQVVITSQFLPTDVRETVNTVKVISRKTIEQRAAINLGELLQNEANMRFTQDAILGSGLNINGLRGQNIKILVDGVPLTGRQNGSIDAGQLPLGTVQQVEIIEGAQSLLYGSDASAGVINLVSRRSQVHKYEASVNTQLESVGLRTYQATTGARFGKFFVQLSGNGLTFEPATDTAYGRDQLWNPKQQYSGRAMVRYAPSRALDLRLSGGLFDETVSDFGDLRRPLYKPYAFDNYYLTKRGDVNLSGEGWTKNKWFWQGTVGLNSYDRVENIYRFDFDDALKTLIPGEQDTSASRGVLTRFTLASDRKDRNLNFLIGLDNQADRASGIRIVDSTATDSGRAMVNDFGFFGSLKYRIFDDLVVQGGARWTQNSLYGTAITPSIWAKYKPNQQVQARLSYAKGFRSPDLNELYYNFVDINHYVVGNRDLQPERSHNFKGEIDWSPKTKSPFSLSFNAKGFYNKVNERIILLEFAPVRYRYLNLQEWETTGGGLGFTLGYQDWFSFNSQALRTGFYNSYSQENDTLNRFNWSIDWVNEINLSLFEQKLGISLWHKATGATPYFYEENKQTFKGVTDAWHQINFSANTGFFHNSIRLNAGVKNLLDVQQIRANNEVFGHNGGGGLRPVSWGRSFFVSLLLNARSKK